VFATELSSQEIATSEVQLAKFLAAEDSRACVETLLPPHLHLVKNRKTGGSNAKTERKRRQKVSSDFAAAHYVRRFETPERLCEVVATLCGLVLSGMGAFGSHKLGIIWTTGIGICAVVLAICFWLTDSELRRRHVEQSKNPKPMNDERSNINISSRGQRGGFTGINQGTVNLGPEPRVLTPDKRAAFVQDLAKAPKGNVYFRVVGGDAEAFAFASQIQEALQSIGYKSGPGMGSFNRLGGQPPMGIVLRIKSEAEAPPFAGEIQRAFHTIDIDAPAEVGGAPEVSADALVIEVGAKP
jgi:hypothetical protein